MRVRGRLFVGLAVIAAALLAGAAVAQAHAAKQHARDIERALNSGDIGAISDMLAENVTFAGCTGPGTMATGKAQVLECFRADIAAGGHVDLSDISDVVDTFRADFEFTSRDVEQAGFERIVGEFEGVVDEESDLITRMSVRFDTSDEQTREFLAQGQPAGGPTRLPQTGDGSLASSDSDVAPVGALALAGAATALYWLRRRRRV